MHLLQVVQNSVFCHAGFPVFATEGEHGAPIVRQIRLYLAAATPATAKNLRFCARLWMISEENKSAAAAAAAATSHKAHPNERCQVERDPHPVKTGTLLYLPPFPRPPSLKTQTPPF